MFKRDGIEYYKNKCLVTVCESTFQPSEVINQVLNNSLKGASTAERIHSVIEMGHTSALEFIDITFMVRPVTKSYLGQVTRHRMASFMSSSYHYSKVKEGAWVLPYLPSEFNNEVEDHFVKSWDLYQRLINNGAKKEEARNVLPSAVSHTLIMKFNARSLFNLFNLRLCYRNVAEMVAVTELMYERCMEWCPEVFEMIGPDCALGGCKQGSMSCGR
jgi:thymidylate synthase (FAD)